MSLDLAHSDLASAPAFAQRAANLDLDRESRGPFIGAVIRAAQQTAAPDVTGQRK